VHRFPDPETDRFIVSRYDPVPFPGDSLPHVTVTATMAVRLRTFHYLNCRQRQIARNASISAMP